MTEGHGNAIIKEVDDIWSRFGLGKGTEKLIQELNDSSDVQQIQLKCGRKREIKLPR